MPDPLPSEATELPTALYCKDTSFEVHALPLCACETGCNELHIQQDESGKIFWWYVCSECGHIANTRVMD